MWEFRYWSSQIIRMFRWFSRANIKSTIYCIRSIDEDDNVLFRKKSICFFLVCLGCVRFGVPLRRRMKLHDKISIERSHNISLTKSFISDCRCYFAIRSWTDQYQRLSTNRKRVQRDRQRPWQPIVPRGGESNGKISFIFSKGYSWWWL